MPWMLKADQSVRKKKLTDAEIYAAIRYLESEARGAIDQGDAANVILTIIFVLLFGSLGLVLFYR